MKLPTLPPTRPERIKLAAGILFGRDGTGEPERGWPSRLARAMGMTQSAVSQTKDRAHAPVFDRKLAPFLREQAIRLRTEADILELMAVDLEAGDVTGTLRDLEL